MTSSLLAAKFRAPVARSGIVRRSRLERRLDALAEANLALISAPAGFGKSTLLAAWRETLSEGVSCAWVSLDTGDDDPIAFWTNVIVAIEAATPDVGAGPSSLIKDGQPPRLVITTLLNELHASERQVVLVLDDYHAINATEIHEGMGILLDRLPPHATVVIATRADPPLALARMRARGQLIEIRAGDLRFSVDEAGDYLSGNAGLELEPADVATLTERTEGWAAALQLAGLSMRGRANVKRFIAGFAGDDRYVIDYLVEEVLQRQPTRIREFLLATSILARMSGPLCDAVTGQRGGRSTLEALDRANLFLVPLDDRREWYRYHHLFADVLRAHLKAERPDTIAELHRRASAWYERDGASIEAIEHAMAAEDYPHAAELIEAVMPAMHQARQEAQLRRVLEALPPAVLRDRPVLTVGYAGVLMQTGQFSGVDELLESVEQLIGHGRQSPTGTAPDGNELVGLSGTVAMYRSALALVRSDTSTAVTRAAEALDLVEEDDHFRRGALSSIRGLAHWTEGDLDEAYRWYSAGMASLERAGYRADVVVGAVTLADIRIAQGRLGDAAGHLRHGLELATRGDGTPLRGAADMHVGLAAIAYERNDLDLARDHLRHAAELGEENGSPKYPWRWRVTTARLRAAEGEVAAAFDLLDEAKRVYNTDFSPDVQPIGAVRARIAMAAGRLDEARAWADERGLTAADEPMYLRDFELATLARVLVAEGRLERDDERIAAAVALTDRLAQAAAAGGRWASAIDVLVVGALARYARRDTAEAVATVSRAIELGERERHVRAFLDEGPAMASLFRHAAKMADTTSPLARLLAARTAEDARPAASERLVEPLSDRELDVLRLLATDLSGPQIAGELVVSLNTVRTHTKNIYAKLGVNSRRAAIRRAIELDVLRRS